MYTLLCGADTVFFPILSHRGTIISTGRRSGITKFCGHGTFPKNKFCAQGTFFKNKFCAQGTFFIKIFAYIIYFYYFCSRKR